MMNGNGRKAGRVAPQQAPTFGPSPGVPPPHLAIEAGAHNAVHALNNSLVHVTEMYGRMLVARAQEIQELQAKLTERDAAIEVLEKRLAQYAAPPEAPPAPQAPDVAPEGDPFAPPAEAQPS